MLRCYRIRSGTPLTLQSLRRYLSHYKTLDVTKDSSPAEIKSSYYAKAKKCHPDIFPDDELKVAEFLKLQDAYFILSDPSKKRSYDGRSSTTANYTATGVHYQTSYNTDYANEHGKRTADGRNATAVIHKLIAWLFIGWAGVVFVGLFANRLVKGNDNSEKSGYTYEEFYRGQGAGSERLPGHSSPWSTRPRKKKPSDDLESAENVKETRLLYLNKMLDKELAGVKEDKRKRAEEVLEDQHKRKVLHIDSDIEEQYDIIQKKKMRRERRRRVKELRRMIEIENAKNPLES